ncbi:MAG: hypothetical protein NTX50_01920 [Candidatus Sumerlaeota bacterium]|nr:hypothetical protein [Candidatus Sumerlaeota bacterium]
MSLRAEGDWQMREDNASEEILETLGLNDVVMVRQSNCCKYTL